MNTILRTGAFDRWLRGLRDVRGKARILARLDKASEGHFGDVKAIGGSVMEMKADFGPGYRIYYTRIGETIYLLLAGGDKSSQPRDVRLAMRLAREWKE